MERSPLSDGRSPRRRLATRYRSRVSDRAAILPLKQIPNGDIDAFIRDTIPTLQGQGYSVDLDYLEPLMPNNGFHPDGNPTPAAEPAPPEGDAGVESVLVVDSAPLDDQSIYHGQVWQSYYPDAVDEPTPTYETWNRTNTSMRTTATVSSSLPSSSKAHPVQR